MVCWHDSNVNTKVLMHTIVMANQKGGVGKTTSTINLGAALARHGYRVLLIDADHQGHTTKGLNIKPEHGTLCDIFTDENAMIEDVMCSTKQKGLWVVPSNIQLARVEMKLSLMGAKEYRLRKKIQKSLEYQSRSKVHKFDYCLIDCPPTFGNICLNSFLAADWVIMPMQLSYFSLEGVDSFIESLNYVNDELGELVGHHIDFLGVLLNFYDPRTNITKEVQSRLDKIFGKLIFDTVVPVNVKLNEAQSKGLPIFDYDLECKGAKAYQYLSEEVLTRIKEKSNG